MKFSFAIFLAFQVTLCTASFDKIREEAEAALAGKAAAATLKQDIDLVKDALALASPEGRWIGFSSANKTGDRQLKRKLKAPKNQNSLKKQNAQCKADLAVAQERIEDLSKPPAAALLGIQTTNSCRVERGNVPGHYKLISDTVSKDTYIFSDRPNTVEFTVPTNEFIRDFDTIFEESPPNVGLTFLQDGNPFGPFVVIFDDAQMNGNEVTYDIMQSENQQGVMSMEALFGNNDSVEFQDCSYFIDDWVPTWLTCPLCKGAVPLLVGLGGEVACDAGCAGIMGAACFPVGGFICAVACIPMCTAIFGGVGLVLADAETVCSGVSLC